MSPSYRSRYHRPFLLSRKSLRFSIPDAGPEPSVAAKWRVDMLALFPPTGIFCRGPLATPWQ